MPSYKHSTPPYHLPSLSSSSSITTDSATALLQLNAWTPHNDLYRSANRPTYEPRLARDQHVVFTRHLWRRSMPNEQTESDTSRSQQKLIASETIANTAPATAEARASRRTSSTVSSRSLRQPLTSPSRGSRTPLTPEESPPFRTTRKRAISALDEDDRAFDSAGTSPSHARTHSGESASQVCICQPDPKIPRPRNAFILYRQHHQAKVIADHPGLANPEISKIIGEQWRNQPADVKNEWKRLAEEEKVRHQQQYPQYRYQPKRNTRRNSLTDTPTSASSEKARCQKCGGRTVVSAGSYAGSARGNSPTVGSLPPQTPTLITTPTSRTLPVLRDLTIQSPASRRMVRPYHPTEMSPRHIDGDEVDPASPDTKRRRVNAEYPVTMYRAMPPRYAVAPIGTAVSPGGHHSYAPPHAYAGNVVHASRRESLPSLHMMSSPGPMGPPPRPGMGYQAHRLSHGHAAPDRSLTLPPLQTGRSPPLASSAKAGEGGKSAKDVIMALPLSLKLEVLRQIAPPVPVDKKKPRGPLIAVEGDQEEVVKTLASWLADTLNKDEENVVKLAEAPELVADGDVEDAMAEYHLLAASWLKKSKDMARDLLCRSGDELPGEDSSGQFTKSESQTEAIADPSVEQRAVAEDKPQAGDDSMSIDSPVDPGSSTQAEKADNEAQPLVSSTSSTKCPVLIIPTYSLRATNFYSCRIPIVDAYGPKEHWQWNATLWRGIIGPDLTIYVKDTDEADQRKTVEHSEAEKLFMVKRLSSEKDTEIDSATLRRVGFEVSEWIRAFHSQIA